MGIEKTLPGNKLADVGCPLTCETVGMCASPGQTASDNQDNYK
jgi:hypothetical protein